ncbi:MULTISPECIES: helix-turn-helix transcriptional regulator [unclassified Methylococcus]|uniref:helix-turn-helix transcriptional regulator n=1 Tax=unclassified Methylococcus TaxID=2618889 RepID=UPI003D7DF7A5
MNRTERFYKIDRMLHERKLVPKGAFLEALGVSDATFKRDIEYMRERLNAPIVWDREARGYRFEPGDGPPYELPGLWFSAAELYALLAAQNLLEDIEPGFLAAHVAPLKSRLAALLESGGHPAAEVARRVKLVSLARRPVEPRFFNEVAQALLQRHQLEISAWNRRRDEVNVRIVSPQRLVHYRDNWYLDAWCHWRDGLRSFSLDTLRQVRSLSTSAHEIPDEVLERQYTSSYGIFSGETRHWAVLRFVPERARWVRNECWHRDQQGELLPDGSYRLRIPYAVEAELAMDVLRHGADVIVEAPESLRQCVRDEAWALWQNHRAAGDG